MSFFRGASAGRAGALRAALLNNLSECVKELQYERAGGAGVVRGEAGAALCAALEALLLHGLRASLLRAARAALADPERRPQPDFWPLVLVLSHRQSVEQVAALPQLRTQIGLCRAWLRAALNDGLLSSYLAALLRNASAARPFYDKAAFVCDAELLELAQRLLEGLESSVRFDIPTNSSLLNDWPEQVLMLAGIWVPTMRSVPISAGLDVASTMVDDEIKPSSPVIPVPKSTISGLGQMLALNEDEALDFILSKQTEDIQYKKPNNHFNAEKTNSNSDQDDKEKPSTSQNMNPPSSPSLSTDDLETFTTADFIIAGNSLSGKTGWSRDNIEELNTSITSDSSHGSSLIKTPESKSLSSLIDHSNTYGSSYIQTPNLREIMRDIHKELKLNTDENVDLSNIPAEVTTPEDPMLQILGFEIIPSSIPCSLTVEEVQKMVLQLGILSREYGLDYQNYQCKGCQDLLGSTVSKAKVCAFTGEYYCTKCMDPNIFMIPARVIHNWDFKRYPVSKKSALFLFEFQHQPWIDMKKLNPKIYSGVSDMAQLQELRIQLNFLRAYIFTCREHVIEELQKKVWPREYLYDHVHQYTISDLAQIPNGSLALQLEKVVSFAKAHVLECWLCSQKGFICEVCKDTKILYPFETATTYRCDECSSVFHAKCLNAHMPCPKCKRKQNRNDSSLVDAINNHFH